MTIGRSAATSAAARPIDLSANWNASNAELAARLHPHYEAALGRLPEGDQAFRGLPFRLGSPAAGARWIAVGDGLTIELGQGSAGDRRASHLVVAHFSDSWRDPSGERPAGMPVGWVLPTGEPLARYELLFGARRSRAVDVRRRFEIADGIIGWGFLPFAAVGHRADETLGWRGPFPRQEAGRTAPPGHAGPLTTLPGAWAAGQSGAVDHVPSADDDITLWLHAIRLDEGRLPAAIRLVSLAPGQAGTEVVLAGLTAFDGTADPLVLAGRRSLLIGGSPGLPVVDLGVGIRARPAGPRLREPEQARPLGWGQEIELEPDRELVTIVDVALAPDARLTFGGWSVGAAELGAEVVFSPDRSVSIRALPDPSIRVDVRVSAGGEPTPCRVRFVAKDGRYLPPVGHRDEVNPGIFEDSGAGLILGADTFAYVPGEFRVDLPPGPVEVEVVKGFDHRPVRSVIQVGPETRELSIALDRPIDLRPAGWLSSDSHVHLIAPSTALLQAAAEDVAFVHLLATQLGDHFINVPDLAWGSQVEPGGRHAVIVGTENRQNVLGHLALLGARRPVAPYASGGAPEGRIGQPVSELLADWAAECHAQGGLVVAAHFPLPFAEIAADIVAGEIDAIEMQCFAPGLDSPSILEWYRFLNCGYRLPVLGGTDKMSAEVPVGAVRTYARLDPDAAPTFAAWSAAVRAGRTFATSGPVLELLVDGHEPGAVLSLPASGGRLAVEVRARAAQPVIRAIELVINGRVVARESVAAESGELHLAAHVTIEAGSWIAARALSDRQVYSAFRTSMAAHTSPVYVDVLDHPLLVAGDAEAILAVIDGTGRWLETMAAIDDPAVRARMVARIEASGASLRGRLRQQAGEVS